MSRHSFSEGGTVDSEPPHDSSPLRGNPASRIIQSPLQAFGGFLSRFLRGLQDRLARLRQQPAARELERITTLQSAMMPDFYPSLSRHSLGGGGITPHLSPGEGGYLRHLMNPAWLTYGLLLSEYRLSIFAPALAQKGRASVKKLQAAAEALR